jgi:hypothetical protein
MREKIFSLELRLLTLEEIYLPKVEDDWLQYVALRFELKSPAAIAYEFLLGQKVDLSMKLEKFPENEGYKILLKCLHGEIEHLEMV